MDFEASMADQKAQNALGHLEVGFSWKLFNTLNIIIFSYGVNELINSAGVCYILASFGELSGGHFHDVNANKCGKNPAFEQILASLGLSYVNSFDD